MEKNNDDCRRVHLSKSNKWDAARDVLLASKRVENLEEFRRKPRKYTKRHEEYWSTTIKENRALRLKNLKTPEIRSQPDDLEGIKGMSPPEIRAKLKNMGFPTRARNIKRLHELYQMAIDAAASC